MEGNAAIFFAKWEEASVGATRALSVAATMVALVAAIGCGGGDSSSSAPCTLNNVDGVVVKIEDATNGHDVCGANVTATDGAFVETLPSIPQAGATCIYSGVQERQGHYRIDVTADGYAPGFSFVDVAQGRCHVQQASVTVKVQ